MKFTDEVKSSPPGESSRLESNQRPLVYKTSALPLRHGREQAWMHMLSRIIAPSFQLRCLILLAPANLEPLLPAAAEGQGGSLPRYLHPR
jgi:hypothetical protein